ncbi:MFS transporter [Candidatus Bipolaricaulota bacterium]|nr:MFS transporter [Candidatus Bipolaricaulota bacterium]
MRLLGFQRWYVSLILANLVMGMSSVLIPLRISLGFHLDAQQLGLAATLGSLAAVVGSLIWGRLSDAAHRRKIFVIASYVMVGFAHVGLALTRSFAGLLVYNAALSFFWVANASVAVLLVIEGADETLWESRIGSLNQSGAFGWLSGLILGGTIIGWTLARTSIPTGISLLLGLLALIAFVASGIAAATITPVAATFTRRRFRGIAIAEGNLLPEAWKFSPLHLYHRLSPSRLKSLSRRVRVFLLSTFFAFTGIAFFAVPLPFVLSQQLEFSASLVFFCYVALHGGIVITYPFAIQRVRSRGGERAHVGALLIRSSLFIGAAVALGSGVHIAWWAVLPFMMLVGATWAVFQLSGVALAARFAKPENRGLALGSYTAVAGISTSAAGICAGALSRGVGYHVSLLVSVVFLVAAAIGIATLRTTNDCELPAAIIPGEGQ